MNEKKKIQDTIRLPIHENTVCMTNAKKCYLHIAVRFKYSMQSTNTRGFPFKI